MIVGNLWAILGVVLFAIFIVILSIWKNRKERKKLEKSLNESELEPEQHSKDQI